MRFYKAVGVGLCIGLFFSDVASGRGADLAQRYRATLDFSEQSTGYQCTAGPEDVWRLKEFDYAVGKAFRVRLGPSQVVFGRYESNVLWAAVFPDEPGQLVAAPQGKGEHVTSVWLRFHPARIGELFPERTVAGQGDRLWLRRAEQLAAHKLYDCWCWRRGDSALVPMKNSLTFDLETREGSRRFYSLDTDSGGVKYEDQFRTLALPVLKPLDSKSALRAFDKVWDAFDRDYAMFAIKPKVDWAELRRTYRPRAAAAKDNQALAAIICEMLDHLEDLHVFVQVDGEWVPGYNRPRLLNANRNALLRLAGTAVHTGAGHGLYWGRSGDGIGYINIVQLSDDALPDTFDQALDQMGDTKGLVLDLRYNGGGSEPLGCQIAGRLLDRERIYSLSQFRSGPGHSDLTPKFERSCGPAGPWHYAGPVVVLQGQKTMSSAESFALALAQCPQVTTMGDRTAGSSGNPRRVAAGAGIVVNLPMWIDMDPQGKPIDAVGISPQVKIEAKAEDFTGDRDPVLAAALDNLKRRAKTEKPPIGGNLQHRPGVAFQRRPAASTQAHPGGPPPKDRPKVVSVSPPPDANGVDTLTDIRIRFDCPMDGDNFWLAASAGKDHELLRVRKLPQYRAETREFVIPVRLKPGVRYRFSFPEGMDPDYNTFWSPSGAGATPYCWQFTTRPLAAPAKAPAPRVLSVDPPSGSQTGRVVALRVCFDRPMDPQSRELVGSMSRADGRIQSFGETGFSVQLPVEYDASEHCFIFHAFLAGNAKARIEMRGFRGADGGEAPPVAVDYQVGADLFFPEQVSRIAAAGHSAKLREVVEAVRRNRLALRSIEETVRMTNIGDELNDRPGWDSGVRMRSARFAFQGDRQFYADLSGIMKDGYTTSFQLGSDGQECWHYFSCRRDPDSAEDERNTWFCPYDVVHDKNVTLADPFGAKHFASTEKAIAALKLEYLGQVEREGRTCHRIRSWARCHGDANSLGGFCDWVIDAQSLLPVVCDSDFIRFQFEYGRINEPIAQDAFRTPAGADIKRSRCKLGKGYDRFLWMACDGSNGRMAVRRGQTGPKGFMGARFE